MIATALAALKAAAGLARARPRLVAGVLGAVAAVAIAAWTYNAGVSAERARWEARVEREARQAQATAARAAARAAAEAKTDAALVAARTEDLDHADDAIPDERPNAKSRAFDCRRLQRDGVSTAGLDCPG